MDRRHLYAMYDQTLKQVVGTYPTIQAADRALKAGISDNPNLAISNVTHGSCPSWVRKEAEELHGSKSAEAEIYMSERLVRITSAYGLNSKASAALASDFHWMPSLSHYMREIGGVENAYVGSAGSGLLTVKVDMVVSEGGGTDDRIRRSAYQHLMKLVLNAARFRWHADADMKENPAVRPIYTSPDFIVVCDEGTGEVSLSWSDGDAVERLLVSDGSILKRLKPSAGSILTDVDAVEIWAKYEMSARQPAPAR